MAYSVTVVFADDPQPITDRDLYGSPKPIGRGLVERVEIGGYGESGLVFYTAPAESRLTYTPRLSPGDPNLGDTGGRFEIEARVPCLFSSTPVLLALVFDLNTQEGSLTQLDLGETSLLGDLRRGGHGAAAKRALRRHEPHRSPLLRELGGRGLLLWDARDLDNPLVRPDRGGSYHHVDRPDEDAGWVPVWDTPSLDFSFRPLPGTTLETPVFTTTARIRGELAAYGYRAPLPSGSPAVRLIQVPASAVEGAPQIARGVRTWYVAVRNLPYAWGRSIWNDVIGELTRPGELDELHAALFSPLLVTEPAPHPGEPTRPQRGAKPLPVPQKGEDAGALCWDLVLTSGDLPTSRTSSFAHCHALRLVTGVQKVYVQARFPLLRDHAGAPIETLLTVQGNSPASGDLGWPRTLETPLQEPGLAIETGLLVGTGPRQRLRIGALDLRFATSPPPDASTPAGEENGGIFRYRLVPDGRREHYRWEETWVELTWATAAASPGGQDDLPGETFVACGGDEPSVSSAPRRSGTAGGDDAFEHALACADQRERPLVIPYPRPLEEETGTAPARLLLRVSEHARQQDLRRIDLRLTSLPVPPDGESGGLLPAGNDELRDACGDEDGSGRDGVVVLDRAPLMVAKIGFPALGSLDDPAAGNEVANWSSYGSGAGTWNIRFPGTRGFCLTLPPQAVGETMEKYHTLGEGERADFRLSPPTMLAMRQSYFRQSFAEAPWNLRNLLADPGRELQGAQLDHLQYELLYGLSCRVDYPYMRIAELEALIGQAPGPLPPRPSWAPRRAVTAGASTGEPADREAIADYDETRLNWAATRHRLRQRLGIFELWDIRRLDTLDLDQNITCWIRQAPGDLESSPPSELLPVPKADLADPFLAPTDPANKSRLEGGVTWGFESRNVYQAVVRPGPGNSWPRSSGAAIDDLRLSALGGYGHQMAAFDHWRSKVLADVAMGRAYSYTLERIGRIAVWWNRAKHVIVYERSVLPSAQFAGFQNSLAGRAVLRKVDEYVELLENDRKYPDRPNAEARATGFVAACTFSDDPNRIVRFRVLSAWGSDVGTIGWKVPLWRPGAQPAEVYPKPLVNLTVLASTDGKSLPRKVTIADPENLFFYTDTQVPPEDLGDPTIDLSNTDLWAPVESIDFADEARP
ncbi:MAG: hypothetical protein M3O15_05405, partial [Acidobacteriota bacterium]|nr:hypothetical protein [Acidobacteriota bacterium]